MPSTTDVTLNMCLAEAKRVYGVMKKHYPKAVAKGKLNPYQRDHRYAVWKKIIQLMETAKENKGTNQPQYFELLKQMPND